MEVQSSFLCLSEKREGVLERNISSLNPGGFSSNINPNVWGHGWEEIIFRKTFMIATVKVTDLFLCWWSCSKSPENVGEKKCLQCPKGDKESFFPSFAHVCKRKKPGLDASTLCKTEAFRLYLQSPHEMTWPVSVLTFPHVITLWVQKKNPKLYF